METGKGNALPGGTEKVAIRQSLPFGIGNGAITRRGGCSVTIFFNGTVMENLIIKLFLKFYSHNKQNRITTYIVSLRTLIGYYYEEYYIRYLIS